MTNKVLALVEVRDWIDVMESSDRLQHLGYLAWAACGKDPGYNPAMILAEARRSGRYTEAEVSQLAFDGPVPAAADLSSRWSVMLGEADALIERLPADFVGQAVLASGGQLFGGNVEELERALVLGSLQFHAGAIGGVLPQIVETSR